ncbi:MAG: helicase-exonuclease AddAB subunit AddA [Desulfocucumaceae bacterium]
MSKVREKQWTAEQIDAITTGGGSLLVSAAAGAGKTAVLVERILNLLKDEKRPVDIDRLLVITFTNAAAAEMRERISSAISSSIAASGGGGRLELQMALINRARITTIHSFCMDVLRQYFYRIDIDPGFRVADETEGALLKADVLEDLFEAMYAQGPEAKGFTDLVECYGGDPDDSGLQDLVLSIYDFSRSNPLPELWLERMAARFDPSGGLTDSLNYYAAVVLSEVAVILEGAVADLEKALALCLRPGGPASYAPDIKDEIAMLRDLSGSCRGGWDQARAGFAGSGFGTLKRAGKDVDDLLKEQVASLRDSVKKRFKAVRDGYLSRGLDDHAADMARIAPLMKTMAELVLLFSQSYRAAKVNRGLVDFSDLEHYCLRILADGLESGEIKPSEVALEIRDRFEQVLVDEYQDINPVQEALIKLVSRPEDQSPNLFMVGDVKQSIYRFRLADPGLFLEKYHRYPEAKGGAVRKINLSKNFRSRCQVLDAVNYVFKKIMAGEAVEIDYDSGAELVFGSKAYEDAKVPGGDYRVELYLLDKSGSREGGPGGEEVGPEAVSGEGAGEEFSDAEEITSVQAEARLIAGRIAELVGQRTEVYDSGAKRFRPVAYSDVVILMRATRGVTGIYIDELSRSGIPGYADTGTGYYDSTEIEAMLSLLKIIDNPRQDIPLAAVLRSPVVGLRAEDLAEVRLAEKSGDLWDAVNAAARQEGGELPARLLRFKNSLGRWREVGRRMSMTDLIWTIYRETGYYYYVGAMPGGAQRQANLRSLHDRAGQFEATTFRGIFSFLRFIDRLREKGEDTGRARTLGENENVVRIMSIHKSKGLEFPVVFVAGLGKKFNLRDLSGDILLHRDLGFGPDLFDAATRVAYPTLAKLAVREKVRRETLAEEMRILYVAMTRAREKLILTGAVTNLDKFSGFWYGDDSRAVSRSDILGAGSYMDWLHLALSGLEGDSTLFVIKSAGIGDFTEKQAAGPEEKQSSNHTLVEKIRRGELVDSEGRYTGEVIKRLSWEYPCRAVSGKPAKLSVTGIGKKSVQPGATEGGEDEYTGQEGDQPKVSYLKPSYARPVFMTDKKGLTPSEKGSAMHIAMRHLDFSRRLDVGDIAEQLDRMITGELITADQASVVNCIQIEAFFKSDPGKRLLSARSVLREAPFSITIPAQEVYRDLKDLCPGEKVLVQGVIDCLADEGDGYLILDYKTDRRTGGDRAQISEKYTTQLKMYSRAVEAITGRPVTGRWLYFFEWGEGYEV